VKCRASPFFRRLLGRRDLIAFYHPAYRLPLAGLEQSAGIEPRRADFAVWALLEHRALGPEQLRQPMPVSYEQLHLVHSTEYLERLSQKETLAQIFGVEPSEVPVDEVLHTVRLACGGTLEAAREALKAHRPILNVLGGFHHAAPSRGGGLSAVNDIAMAIAALRRDGFSGRVAVLDLDAHPPDGTVECLRSDPEAWIGSLSASDWGELRGADETLLPQGCGDEEYLGALHALLSRMPKSVLVFVVAGGDVLAGDRFGMLGLTLEGVRRRDASVLRALGDVASVWLPGGGYHPDAWRVLTRTGFVLAGCPHARLRPSYEPLPTQFGRVSRSLGNEALGGSALLSEGDLDQDLRKGPRQSPTVLGLYTKEGLENAFFQYGVTPHIQRLGYANPQVELDTQDGADRIRLFGQAGGQNQLLLELVVERRRLGGSEVLFVNWLALRHPLAQFNPSRPRLPGQDVPGLGLAPEIGEMLALMAQRLGLDGVAFRPSWYHTAYAARYRGRFVDPKRQGRFEALIRDLSGVPLLTATTAVADGRVKLNGKPYQWEADEMVTWVNRSVENEPAIAAEREGSHFTLDPIGDLAEPAVRPQAS
jgi:acetoin utilization deacetylase AcuC-like enzyme